jgi:hypothetical protein
VDTCGNVSKEKGDAISFWPMNNTYWIFEKQYLSVSRPRHLNFEQCLRGSRRAMAAAVLLARIQAVVPQYHARWRHPLHRTLLLTVDLRKEVARQI